MKPNEIGRGKGPEAQPHRRLDSATDRTCKISEEEQPRHVPASSEALSPSPLYLFSASKLHSMECINTLVRKPSRSQAICFVNHLCFTSTTFTLITMKFMTIFTTFAVALIAPLQLVAAIPITEASLEKRDVFVPPVLYPHAGTVWTKGQRHNVTW